MAMAALMAQISTLAFLVSRACSLVCCCDVARPVVSWPFAAWQFARLLAIRWFAFSRSVI